MRGIVAAAWAGILAGSLMLLAACQAKPAEQTVVVYTSVDQVYSEPILKRFEETAGIRVLPVYDVEAAKTTGLVNRLIAEKDRPQADLFWNGEFAQTLLLKDERVLAPYRPPAVSDLPAQYVDPEGYWTGLAGRARVLLAAAEQEAVRRGCRHAHLDTMSFQALPFYQKQGYVVFGELHDIPAGSGQVRYSMKKQLVPNQ